MRIHSMPLHHAYHKHNSPTAADRAAADASSAGTTTAAESSAAPANTSGEPGKPEDGNKLTPAGLLAAQLRFQSMNSEDMTKGQTRALEVINRNIERYRAHHGIPPPAPAADPVATTQPTTASEPAADTATPSTPPPTASTEPTTTTATPSSSDQAGAAPEVQAT